MNRNALGIINALATILPVGDAVPNFTPQPRRNSRNGSKPGRRFWYATRDNRRRRNRRRNAIASASRRRNRQAHR